MKTTLLIVAAFLIGCADKPKPLDTEMRTTTTQGIVGTGTIPPAALPSVEQLQPTTIYELMESIKDDTRRLVSDYELRGDMIDWLSDCKNEPEDVWKKKRCRARQKEIVRRGKPGAGHDPTQGESK